MSNIIGYGCKNCKSELPLNTKNSLVFCNCKKIGIISSFDTIKIVGNRKLLFNIKESEKSIVYRFKKINSEKYYSSFGKLDKIGKIYRRTPSIKWLRGFDASEFIIEKFILTKLIP